MNFPVYATGITMAEMPKNISFYLQLAECRIRCAGCHSKELWGTTEGLDFDSICTLVRKSKLAGANMIIIFGDTNNNITSNNLNLLVSALRVHLPICIYSGADSIEDSLGDCRQDILKSIDYIKLGHYDERLGGLNSYKTNQIMYKVAGEELVDVTRLLFKVR